MTEKEFHSAVFQYLANHPQGVPDAVKKLATQCEVSEKLIWKYATGRVCPGEHMQRFVTEKLV